MRLLQQQKQSQPYTRHTCSAGGFWVLCGVVMWCCDRGLVLCEKMYKRILLAHFKINLLVKIQMKWNNVYKGKQAATMSSPWWWSSGQRARLLFRWSKFKSLWSLQFSCKFVVEKDDNEQKEVGVWKQQSVKFKIIKENRDSTEVQFKVNRSEEGKLHYRFKYNTLIEKYSDKCVLPRGSYTMYNLYHALFSHQNSSDIVWPVKSRQMSIKVAQIDFTRKIKDFYPFTKIS